MSETIKQITEDEFHEIYRPIKNFIDSDASWDGELWETFGEELTYCFELAKKENRVWTILECDDIEYDPDDSDAVEEDEENYPKACMVIVSGFHLVNRMGFMVTEVPYTEETEVKLDL